ncbi:homogentisate 1,2-dioxygenase domain protein [Mycobacterium ulcerans str. Harvey]|uniref:Homogentisate 1,2-dioxygenase domain protein n=1 Tax=Mycobacterium ulcerans str. Harvey TaxID=1299332 RepID=A0ABN0QY16_MYCUL|nr:homogentisate 1,2-dioxygenase domain protein [Mycobacterium ulcerans str. Harvey]
MESFVHLRKGRTPRRLHADLDGLKDDELGRGGFTGRTANLYRRHDPTAYRAVGPLRPVDVLADQLEPSDATDANGGPLLMFSNADCRILLSRRHQVMPFYNRHVDGDLLCFVHDGAGCWKPSSGRCVTAPATGCISRRRPPGASCRTSRRRCSWWRPPTSSASPPRARSAGTSPSTHPKA